MKFRRFLGAGVALIMLFSIAGCGNPTSGQDSGGSSENSAAASSAQNAAESSEPAVSSASSAPAAPQTHQEVLTLTRAALDTKMPVMLPTDVPTGEGCYLTSATVSQAQSYHVNFYAVKQATAVNAKDATQGEPIVEVSGAEEKSEEDLQDIFSACQMVNPTNSAGTVDLGHGIEGYMDAGLGHAYLTWYEGTWCMVMDGPNDPANRNPKYPDQEVFAKQIVEYLDTNKLPVSRDLGLIFMNLWGDLETVVSWQDGMNVYQVMGKDPMTVLQVAVAMKLS